MTKAQFMAHELNRMRFGEDYVDKIEAIHDWLHDIVDDVQWATLTDFIGSWYLDKHLIQDAEARWTREIIQTKAEYEKLLNRVAGICSDNERVDWDAADASAEFKAIRNEIAWGLYEIDKGDGDKPSPTKGE